ncbi:RHS repeat-associated core domain-containing protein [Nonomuraea jabiensis]|uniref:RHS repeat-associated protein n=1 Tax=Nonomuraea jabiensis TaxID=882448 RepID=A0A7W9FXL6_9ACTN|nr:RHS repeat-associated core domain-containing protein [Nonomuraea jabiensis]MBB5773445.1 RHS repeat-associated protein [Nonomuraea jabiensis]
MTARPLGVLFRALEGFLRSPATGARVAGASGTRRALRSGGRGRERPLASRVTAGDPIDVATGEVVLHQVDAEVAGTLPLAYERTHVSSYRAGRLFGASWASTLDERLEAGDGGMWFATADGMVLSYPVPVAGTPVLPAAGPRWPLQAVAGGYTITDPYRGLVRHFAATELAAISDRNGNRVEFARGDDLLEVRHPGGRTVAVELEDGRASVLRVAGEVLARYRYDEDRRLREVTGPSGARLRFDYDAAGRLTAWTDSNGFHYGYTYDEQGRAIRGAGSGGFLDVTLSYAADATTVTDSRGHATTYHFNELRQVVAEVDSLGRRRVSEWDRDDRLLSRTDPLGRTTRYGYDVAGNLTSVIRPDGRRMTARYDELNLPVEIVEADGAVWRHRYDPHGNLVAVTDPCGGVTRHAYDQRGRLTATTDAVGETTRVETDAAGLLSAVTSPLGATTRFERDAMGRVTTIVDPAGGVTRLAWSPRGELLRHTTPGGATERWAYDGEGNVVETVDAAGGVTRTEFGPFDLPVAEVGPDGARTEYSYDGELRLVAITGPTGLVWRYEYDAAGNLVREVDFDGRVQSYAYDAGGRLREHVNGARQVVRYSYDLLDNVVEESGDRAATFAYDAAGRLVHAANADADLRLEYDALGRIVAETCNGRTLTSGYDLAGRRLRRSTPSGARADWSYDAGGRPAELRTAGTVIRFRHDATGREVERRLGDRVVLAQSWHADHHLAAQTVGGRSHRSYAYRPDGLLSAVTDGDDGPRRYELDAAGRVTAVESRQGDERYAYDLAGNITWAAPGGGAGERRRHSGSMITRAGSVRYAYDEQGRAVRRTQETPSGDTLDWRYAWDAADRLVAVVSPEGQTWRYRYDPLGRRIAKQRLAAGGTGVAEQIDFVWDGDTLAEEVAGGHVTTWDYEPGTVHPLAQAERSPAGGPELRVIVTDQVGAPAELVDAGGRVVARIRTTLWGEGGPAGCPLRFPGQYRDGESGLHYNHHRHYDPAIGRYLSRDPLGPDPAPNPYAYVPNPTFQIDPLGLAPCMPKLHIAFGLNKNGQLKAFAATVNARTYFNLPKEWYVGEFRDDIRHIVNHPSVKISFNLTGINSARASVRRVKKNGRSMGLRRGREFMGRKVGYTDFELYAIANAPHSWSRITWYRESRLPWRKGEGVREVGNPFG